MYRTQLLSQLIRQQQRLFTGSLFPEEVNDKLHSFAQRHGLKSNVWVPRKAFEAIFKFYGVFVLPSAALCDITGMVNTPYLELEQTLGRDRVVVNSDHTSNPTFIEHFFEYIVPNSESDENSTSYRLHGNVKLRNWSRKGHIRVSDSNKYKQKKHGPKDSGGVNLSVPSQGVSLAFQHPLRITGPPILNGLVVKALLKIQSEKGYRMNYWIAIFENFRQKKFKNAEELPWPGRYNPTWCHLYKPHTRTNQSFPPSIRILMLQRAVEYGYISRLWVTLREAEELYQTVLLPEHAHDSPPIFCNAITGGIGLIQFYCADQFKGGALFFCNYMETNLCVNGVWMPPDKLRGFPLLKQLLSQSGCADDSDTDSSKSLSPTSALNGEVSKTKSLVSNSERQTQFLKAVDLYENIYLFMFTLNKIEQKFLHHCDIHTKLRTQCILNGFPTPHFICSKSLSDYELSPGFQEVGFLYSYNPIYLWGNFTWLQCVSWFNIAQLAEPLVALMLIYRHPRHFLTGKHLNKLLATQCARLQVLHQYKSHEWITKFILSELGWNVQRGAPCAFNVHYINATSDSECINRITDRIFYNFDEVSISHKTKDWLINYHPVNSKGCLFVTLLQSFLKLRAYERGYRSTVWVVIQPFRGYRLKDTITPVVDDRRPLSNEVFLKAPMVEYGEYLLANEEDAESCSPGESFVAPEKTSAPYDNEDDSFILSTSNHKSDTAFYHSVSFSNGDKPLNKNGEWI
ncbi:unnamed protein product [Phytomonas sp. Hart1]|nr:unnamed protein product [Phytomonas sp. Hart1]|eukprot:CCW68719.1 unnamed protein product [Phytomonas sp. isolate Hart1]